MGMTPEEYLKENEHCFGKANRPIVNKAIELSRQSLLNELREEIYTHRPIFVDKINGKPIQLYSRESILEILDNKIENGKDQK